ncbi:MAG: hypothetical protein LUB56_02190, partial [Coprobacillus sp.]|nr:hypothetical protein [Coprobacillus sp.]
SWSLDQPGAESRHTTVYYDSADGNTYFHRTDIGEGHDYTDNTESNADSPSASDYTVTASYNTYEQWGMLSSHEFGYSPFSYILDNMVGCGSMIAEALGGSGEDGSFDFGMTIPSSLNGLITGLSVETTEESETVVSLDLSLGSLFTGDASILDELSIALTLTEGNTVSEIVVELPIDYSLGILGSATFIIGVDLKLDESSSKDLSSITNGNDPFAEFEAYIAAHTCTCEECDCEDGECGEDCECEQCEGGCYFIQDKIVEKLWLDETLTCSCGCETCILGQCTCQSMGVCTCGDSSCTCTTTNA